MRRPVVLIIRDGWAVADDHRWDATYHASTPNHDRLFSEYGVSRLLCHGRSVGLPDGIMGNSEVGHLNIGAGRIVKQESLHIREESENGGFFKNEHLLSVIRDGKPRLHFMGLASDGIVHSDLQHLHALLLMAKRYSVEEVYLHLFLDGRDTPPKSALKYIKTVEEWCRTYNARVATVCGRYYAMDRDRRWERTEKAYNAVVSAVSERTAKNAKEALRIAYDSGETDEFVTPTVIKGERFSYTGMEEGDGVVFFNFRADRARQLTKALILEEFNEFNRSRFVRPNLVTFTLYDDDIPAPYAFSLPPIRNNLGRVLSKAGIRQFRTAETEKYAHVTYFFNSGEEEPYPGEDRLLVPSPKVATYDLKPEMSAYEVTNALIRRIKEEKYQFLLVNYANCDMVGHTGDWEATIRAVEVVDECVGKVVDTVLDTGGIAVITADHGNAESMRINDTPHTYHTKNPVHFCICNPDKKMESRSEGILADIAPTLLQLLGIDQPPEMTGNSMLLA